MYFISMRKNRWMFLAVYSMNDFYCLETKIRSGLENSAFKDTPEMSSDGFSKQDVDVADQMKPKKSYCKWKVLSSIGFFYRKTSIIKDEFFSAENKDEHFLQTVLFRKE